MFLIDSARAITKLVCNLHINEMLCLSRVKVRLGELDLDETVDDKSQPQDIDVDRAIKHNEYRKSRQGIHDIAIVKMKRKVSFTGTLNSA